MGTQPIIAFLGSWLLAAAPTPDFPEPLAEPPVAPEMQWPNDLSRSQVDIVPPPPSELQLEQIEPPPVVTGRLIESDRKSYTVAISTPTGERTVTLSPRTRLGVDGRYVRDITDLPPGEDVIATLDENGDAVRVDVTTRSWGGFGGELPPQGHGPVIPP